MQGFNKYLPPDFDPKKTHTINEYRGKHALGDRARKIDQGILIVRFELPFSIWCGGCDNHLGAGVRYNAEKRKVGNYYSTPIYAFRCKCHLCSSWFEIRTDPQNARYIVQEGARAQNLDWDPEENGGFAAHDTDAPSASDAPTDAFAHLEKTVDQKTFAKTKLNHLEQLEELSHRQTSDPYARSQELRARFRAQKKVDTAITARDDGIRERAGLRIALEAEVEDEGREEWRKRSLRMPAGMRMPRVSKGKGKAKDDLALSMQHRTRQRVDPFGEGTSEKRVKKAFGRGIVDPKLIEGCRAKPKGKKVGNSTLKLGLVDYVSASE